jgi:alpha,alpha-trehalose phosphorylase (configuration-retaining)
MYIDASHVQAVSGIQSGVTGRLPIPRTLDEQSDSAARKCVMYFGPNNNPRLSIGPRNQVMVDAGGKIHLIDDLSEYQKTVGPRYADNTVCVASHAHGEQDMECSH